MALRRTAVAAVLVALAAGVPASGSLAAAGERPTVPAAAPAPGGLAALRAELADVTARAEELAGRLERAAARDGGLRIAMDDLAQAQERARQRFGARVREVYMASGPAQLDPLRTLRPGRSGYLARRAGTASLSVEHELVDALTDRSAAAQQLRARAARFRRELLAEAGPVLAAQERARELLARAEAAAAVQAADAADRAAARAALAASRAQLDAVSAVVTLALTPAQTDRSRRAARDEAPVLAAVEAAGGGYPRGWAPTGQVITGEASWYGPGFVGNPTASGAPYDPERMTCAHKDLPLGTVVRVSRAGLAVSCLVNDRGPYVGDRVLDMSRAGSRALGYDGVAVVTIEVLAPVR